MMIGKFLELRRVCKSFSELVGPHGFARANISFRKANVAFIEDFLRSMALPTSPYARWGRLLSFSVLSTSSSTRTRDLAHDWTEYGSDIDGDSVQAQKQERKAAEEPAVLGRLWEIQKACLIPALKALTRVEKAKSVDSASSLVD